MRRFALAWLLALVAGACGGTEPIELADSYVLSTVEGGSPPRLVAASVECDVLVGGGSLTFGPAEQFELTLEVETDCSRGGGESPDNSTYGYVGTADVDGRRVVFNTATGLGPVVFEGQATGAGRLETVVPGLLPLIDEVAVEFVPE